MRSASTFTARTASALPEIVAYRKKRARARGLKPLLEFYASHVPHYAWRTAPRPRTAVPAVLGPPGAGTLGGAAGRGGTAGVSGYRACAAPPDFSRPGFDCCVTICVAAAPNAGFTALTELGSFDFSYAWRGGVTGFTSQGFLDFTQSSPVATCGSADLRAQLSVVTLENYAAPPLGQQSVQISLASAMTTGTLDVLSIADSGILSGTLDVPAWRVHVSFEAPLCRDLYTIDR